MLPYSVNAEMAEYPDITKLADYLNSQCEDVVFIEKFPDGVEAVLYNMFLLGRAVKMRKFPLSKEKIEQAINNIVGDYYRENTIKIYKMGLEYGIKEQLI